MIRVAFALLAATLLTGCGLRHGADNVRAGAVEEAGCDDDATERVTTFYRRVIADGDSGLPDPQRMPALAPLLTVTMHDAIEAARVTQRAFIEASPDDKPPFIEGSLFTSLFEGADAVEGARRQTHDETTDAVKVIVSLRNGEGVQVHRWQDVVIVRCQQSAWRIDDVVFGGDWDFASSGSLRAALRNP